MALGVWGLGARGLVGANAVTMAMRVGWSWEFVGGYLDGAAGGEGLRVRDMVPTVGSLVVGLSARWCLVNLLNGGSDVGLAELMQIGVVVGLCGVGM